MPTPIELYDQGDINGAGEEAVRRMRAIKSHDFDDPTCFCTKCGQSEEHVLDTFIACFGQPKVTAISHRVRGAQLRRAADQSYVGMNFMDALAKFHEDNRPDSA